MGHWWGSVLCAPFSTVTLLMGDKKDIRCKKTVSLIPKGSLLGILDEVNQQGTG